MLFAKRCLFLWLTHPTWRHPGLFPPGPSYPIFEQETCKLMIMASRSHYWPSARGPTGHQWATSQRASNVLHGTWKNVDQTVELYTSLRHFCDLIAIQILHDISYDIMHPVHLHPGWQNAFSPAYTYRINSATNRTISCIWPINTV